MIHFPVHCRQISQLCNLSAVEILKSKLRLLVMLKLWLTSLHTARYFSWFFAEIEHLGISDFGQNPIQRVQTRKFVSCVALKFVSYVECLGIAGVLESSQDSTMLLQNKHGADSSWTAWILMQIRNCSATSVASITLQIDCGSWPCMLVLAYANDWTGVNTWNLCRPSSCMVVQRMPAYIWQW